MLASAVICDSVAWSRYSGRPDRFGDTPAYNDGQATSERSALAGDILLGLGGALVVAAIVWAAVVHRQRRGDSRAEQ